MFFTYVHCPGLTKFAYDRVNLTAVNHQGLSLYLPPTKQLYLPKMVLHIWILNNCIRQYQPNYSDQFYFSQLKFPWSLLKLLFRLSTNYSTRFVLRYVWPWLWITPARAFDFSECHFSGGHIDNTPDKKFCCVALLGFIQSLQWILNGDAQFYLRLLPPAFFSPPSSLTFLSTSCSFLARNSMNPFALPTWFCFSSLPDQHQMSFRLQLTFCVCKEISYTPIFFPFKGIPYAHDEC